MEGRGFRKKEILKAKNKRGLEKEIERYRKLGYLPASDIKHFEDDNMPYQILVEKRWSKEHRNGTTKVV